MTANLLKATPLKKNDPNTAMFNRRVLSECGNTIEKEAEMKSL